MPKGNYPKYTVKHSETKQKVDYFCPFWGTIVSLDVDEIRDNRLLFLCY